MKNSFNIQELFALQSPNAMEPSPCTPPPRELSNYTKNKISSIPKSKCHGTKPMHPSSSRAFQQHQEQDLKHPKVQMPWNQAHAPLLLESFPKTPRTRSQASQFPGSHNYERKQTTFTDRLGSIRHLGSLRETLFSIVDDFFPQVLKCLL